MLKGDKTHKRQDDIIYGYLWGCEAYYYIPHFKGLSIIDMKVDLPMSEPSIRNSLKRLEEEGRVEKNKRIGTGKPINLYRAIPIDADWLNDWKMKLRVTEI